ncbi:Putative inner membrane protein [Ruaniaceae bacterium KH17]|nr:Putative inner membrane protein [Ruaniaceae bacterium KH17]
MPGNVDKRYVLSFTTGGLLAREAAVLAPIFNEQHDWAKVRDLAVSENLLQARTRSTSVRRVRATIERLSALSDTELGILEELTASERSHLMWAAACRFYKLVGEFAEEVLRERFLTLAGTVSYDDYDSFYRAKALWHDELGAVSDQSYKKLRQVLFRMMVEAGLVNDHGGIEPTLVTARVGELLSSQNPSDIRFFPTRETH